MRAKRGILERISTMVDIQDEPLPGIPLVEIAGYGRVLIENHYGVAEYGDCCIRVRVKYGFVCICGKNLVLNKMIKGQLVITGDIQTVELQKGCK